MSYYIRKVDKAKWLQTDKETKDIAADAVTNCLNTKKNQLSFWKVDILDEESINEVVKSMISSFSSGVDTFDIVYLEDKQVEDFITPSQTTPTLPYMAYANNHYDFIDLTLSSLSKLSNLIYSNVCNNQSKRITKSVGKKLVDDLILSDPTIKEKLHTTIKGSNAL